MDGLLGSDLDSDLDSDLSVKCLAVAQTAGLNAGQALKSAVKNVQAGQKLEKQKGKEFQALVQLMQASRQ